MIPHARFTFGLLLLIALASVLSYFAFHGFWVGVYLFGNVPAARLCDSLGQLLLAPARALFWLTGRALDPTAPLADPFWYVVTNGALIGIGAMFLLRKFTQRGR
jgi:hypothetical protein